MQRKAFEKVRNHECRGILLILQHEPTYTIGTGGGMENLLNSEEFFQSRGIDIVKINRGGNITFHGPGQLVVYPIFDLNELKKDAHWYISCLEETVIRVLKQYGISGSRKQEYRGVWVKDQKVSAVGVAIKHWITYHGLSFNINLDKKYFDWINPCGIKDFGICSLDDFTDRIDISRIMQQMRESFEEVFEIKLSQDYPCMLEI